jgi:hypothetical protein
VSTSIPTFVVVGHVNKGKSSVVATLTEDPTVPIDWTPGTTAHTGAYTLVVDGQPVMRLLDTPGFQDAPAALEWMQLRAHNAAERSQAISDFVRENEGQDRFSDEVELLRNLQQSDAGILYVVDGSRPYRPSHEAEMEILRWSGKPGMALINRIGSHDYSAEWKPVLLQFFNAVRDFDAHKAGFDQRVGLLQSFAEVRDEWKPALQQAVHTLQRERLRRDRNGAELLASSLQRLMTHVEKVSVTVGGGSDSMMSSKDSPAVDEQLRKNYRSELRNLELQQRNQVNRLYGHTTLASAAEEFELLNEDLFSQTSWKVFGLTPRQLALYAAGWGAVLGGGLDLMVGTLSFGAGALLGALTGGIGAWLGSTRLSKTWDSSGAMFKQIFPGETGRYRCFGPLSNPRFAWVLLDRALMHWSMVRDRAHAMTAADAERISDDDKKGIVAHLPKDVRDPLDKGLRQILQSGRTGKEWTEAQHTRFADALMRAVGATTASLSEAG